MKLLPQSAGKDRIILTHAEESELCDELAALTSSPMTPLSPSLAALRDLLAEAGR